MTDATAKLELTTFLPDEAPTDTASEKKSPWRTGGLLFAILAILSYFVSDYAIETRKSELLVDLQKRLEIGAAGEAEVIETWLTSSVQAANRIANSELFQLFTTEVNLTSDRALPRALADQLPYMQNAMTAFARQNFLTGAYLIGKDGRAYLASGGAPALDDQQREAARGQYSQSGNAITPFRTTPVGLTFDFLVPIMAAQSNGAQANTVGVLLMTVPASKSLGEFLAPSPLTGRPYITRLFQLGKEGFVELFPQRAPFMGQGADPDLSLDKADFEALPMPGGGILYSSGAPVPGTNLFVFQQVRDVDALKSLKTYKFFVTGLAASIVIVVLSLFATIWLVMKNQNAHALTTQYKDFAAQINVQRRLLGSINNTIDEQIGLTDPEGLYIYANPSLARLADVPLRAIPGKTDRDLFGEKAARELAEHDRKAIATEQTINAFIDIETVHGKRTLRIAKSRFVNDEGLFVGIVTVGSDITEYVEFQRRKEEMGQKTISVLAHMLEANDPYLADHSSRLGRLANYISEELGLAPETRQIIETGAHLSQIGKISIPREIRVKEARLSDEEQKIMQDHVNVAEAILREAEIEKPVRDAITQINEHLDGTGYPNALRDEDIDMPGRILGMADILIARISPRGYRKTIGIDEALRVFKSNPGKYDQKIVQAMTDFFETDTGAKFKSEIENKS